MILVTAEGEKGWTASGDRRKNRAWERITQWQKKLFSPGNQMRVGKQCDSRFHRSSDEPPMFHRPPASDRHYTEMPQPIEALPGRSVGVT